jgi:aspartyl-tRNA(Asn)/glutamyl-tRNA(Gln) amidotransferase subunit C
MITKEEIKNLADLARIEIGDEEALKLTKDVDAILLYVGQIKDAVGDVKPRIPTVRNIMREDVVTTKTGEYTDKLLAEAPERDGKYFKVKKIL